MKQKKILLTCTVLAAAVLLALGLRVLGAQKHPALTLPQGDGVPSACQFSPDFAVPEEEGRLYALMPQSRKELEQTAAGIIGIEDLALWGDGSGLYYVEETGDTVTIESNGFFSITNEGKPIGEPLTSPAAAPQLPGEEEAIETAKAFLSDTGLCAGDPGPTAITHSTGAEGPLTIDVTFFPGIHGKEVYGLYRLRVSLGDGGKVQSVIAQAAPIDEGEPVPLKTTQQVIKEVSARPEDLCFLGEGTETALFTQCTLAYYTDGSTGYAHPVYVLTGQGAYHALLDAAR